VVAAVGLLAAGARPTTGQGRVGEGASGGEGASALVLRAGALPPAVDGHPYSAALPTRGAMGYCSWDILDGNLPRGLQLGLELGCQAQVVGVPRGDRAGHYAFRVEVYDLVGGEASAPMSIDIAPSRGPGPGPPAPPIGGSPGPEEKADRPNWSGYVTGLGPYRSVEGTFTVPYIVTARASCSSQVSAWVGLDGGATFSPAAGRDLLQAGVGESTVNPYTDTCTAGQFYIWAWWEAVPRPEAWIWSLDVHAGDRVTVDIHRTAADRWLLTLTDDTTGRSFSTRQTFNAHPTTAEWVVEATEVPGLCGQGEAPSVGPGICPLAPFGPPVAFRHLASDGTTERTWRVEMVQRGARLSVPTPWTPAGFNVGYSG
jgi:Peptidase A4 family